MIPYLLLPMTWLQKFFGKSDSSFVRQEILAHLPKSVTMEFIPELDTEGNPIIFIHSPEHEGLLSEARNYKEAIENAQDAILTYFDVPYDCAVLVQFDVEDIAQKHISMGENESIRICEFRVRDPAHV